MPPSLGSGAGGRPLVFGLARVCPAQEEPRAGTLWHVGSSILPGRMCSCSASCRKGRSGTRGLLARPVVRRTCSQLSFPVTRPPAVEPVLRYELYVEFQRSHRCARVLCREGGRIHRSPRLLISNTLPRLSPTSAGKFLFTGNDAESDCLPCEAGKYSSTCQAPSWLRRPLKRPVRRNRRI